MNHMTLDTPEAPWNDKDSRIFECTNCWERCSDDINDEAKFTEKIVVNRDPYCEECIEEITDEAKD
jgi:hypothetical protein